MIDVERKYLILFFVRWRGFLERMRRYAGSRLAAFVERTGPVLLLGPFLGRKFVDDVRPGLILLIPTSLLMIGGVPAGMFTLLFGLMGAAFFILGSSAATILSTYLQGGSPLPGLAPVIPGVQVGPYYIPLVEGWLAILLLFLIHEGAHGVLALRKGIDIRDSAMVLLTIVPVAAYVMPDEEAFKRADPRAKVSVLAAGPTANILAFIPAALLLLLIGYLALPYMEDVKDRFVLGVQILEVPDVLEINGRVVPSLVKGKMEPGDVILAINGERVKDFSDIIELLHSAEGNTVTVTFLRDGREANITIPNEGYLGVRGGIIKWREEPPPPYKALSFLLSFLGVFSMLNLAVAVVNALPFSILDGGQAVEELEKKGGIRAGPLRGLALVLILVNLLPWFI